MHFSKSSHFASVVKRSDAVLHYLSAPAQSSKVLAEQPSQTGSLEGRLCAQLWVEDREKQSFLSQIWAKNIEKGIGGLLPTRSHSLGGFEGGAFSWDESSSLSLAGRAWLGGQSVLPPGTKAFPRHTHLCIPQIPAPEPLPQPPLTSQAGSARTQSMSSSKLGQ